MTLNLKDFATGIVVSAPVPSNSGLTLTLQTGEGARMPAVPFLATAHPATEMPTLDNAEKILVTNVTGDVLTIVRAQGETTAKSIVAGWRVSNALFADDIAIALADLTDDATHRLVTDTEKSTWNAKQPAMGADDNYVTDAQLAALHPQVTGGTPALSFGTANTAGNASTFIRTNDTILAFDATALTAEAIGSTSSVGTATTAARRDHRHPMPSALAMLAGLGGGYAACATAIGTAAKTVALTGYTLVVGGTVGVTFTNGNSAANPTLDINSAGAKPIFMNGGAATTIAAGARYLLMYDGTNYNMVTGTKALGTDADSGTDDVRFLTSKSVNDSHNIPYVVPGTSGNVMTSNGTDWGSSTLPYLGSITYDELLTGTPNGVITVFTTAANFTNIQVYKNGVAMHLGDDFTITGANQITFTTAPATGTKLTATYINSNSVMIQGSNSTKIGDSPYQAIQHSGIFVTSVPYIPNSLEVFVNGLSQKPVTHFTETSPEDGIFTLNETPLDTDIVTANLQFVQSVSGNADTLDGFHATDFYPVGTIYSNKTNSANPSTYLPGQAGKTWIAVEGVVVVGKAASGTFATAGATVGVETVTLTAAQSGLPAHTHLVGGGSGAGSSYYKPYSAGGVGDAASGGTIGLAAANTAANASAAHTNIQPSLVAYVWERTA